MVPAPPILASVASHATPTPLPALPAAPTAAPAPEIHIGRIEVVMAPPATATLAPRPAATPPRPAVQADFSRYAAMRGARDRRW
jgi:hypothetical protein